MVMVRLSYKLSSERQPICQWLSSGDKKGGRAAFYCLL
ncbi:hypothetical protein RNAN_1042 [Rheinheimera nanhaiensis E407-8]|uniref:Uncharacterized protein n=1 Tax=Rheinheimera nanhaiensis E407-8 TaxID=562729 RepID=I1DVJ3_9GAMM|nr:hypothetical protein RNAN_1042 [Rheinheimera nanhaiensis E407-8]